MPRTDPAQKHFDQIAGRYERAAGTWKSVYDAIRSRVEPRISGRRVLDIGNGGFFPYDPARARSVTAVDISPEMLERIRVPGISKVVDDARTLERIPNQSFDVVLYFLCLHHINGPDVKSSVQGLTRILSAAKKKLTAGGEILIGEPSPAAGIAGLQDLLYPVTRSLLASQKVSMIYFFKKQVLVSALAQILQIAWEQVRCEPIPAHGWVDPLGGSFPGILKIPSSLLPTRYHFLSAQLPL